MRPLSSAHFGQLTNARRDQALPLVQVSKQGDTKAVAKFGPTSERGVSDAAVSRRSQPAMELPTQEELDQAGEAFDHDRLWAVPGAK